MFKFIIFDILYSTFIVFSGHERKHLKSRDRESYNFHSRRLSQAEELSRSIQDCSLGLSVLNLL